jgi:hypothetical protein
MTKQGNAPAVQAPADASRYEIEECGHWLAYCLRIGWRRDDLDMLELLWWKYRPRRKQPLTGEDQ